MRFVRFYLWNREPPQTIYVNLHQIIWYRVIEPNHIALGYGPETPTDYGEIHIDIDRDEFEQLLEGIGR